MQWLCLLFCIFFSLQSHSYKDERGTGFLDILRTSFAPALLLRGGIDSATGGSMHSSAGNSKSVESGVLLVGEVQHGVPGNSALAAEKRAMESALTVESSSAFGGSPIFSPSSEFSPDLLHTSVVAAVVVCLVCFRLRSSRKAARAAKMAKSGTTVPMAALAAVERPLWPGMEISLAAAENDADDVDELLLVVDAVELVLLSPDT